ncbi:Fis family transcriptional regulator [Kozakia baliensis]|nr:Fis family transcriptional regulator [Kozakia baliensis]
MSSTISSHGPIAALPAALRSSWTRCAENYGIIASDPLAEELLCSAELRQARERMGLTMKICDPELDRLQKIVSALDYDVLLADPSGVVVARRGAPPFEKGCRRWHLWPGANWSEAEAGTNGIGTCLVEGTAVTVHGRHHWRTGLRYLTCSAVPFYGPNGQVAGALDVSSMRPQTSDRIGVMMEAILIDTARRLERRSFLEAFRHRSVILLGDGPGISLPMVALDEARMIVGATRAARNLLNIENCDTTGICFDLDNLKDGKPNFQEAERSVIEGALAMSQGKIAPAARLLGISRSTLHRKLKSIGFHQA